MVGIVILIHVLSVPFLAEAEAMIGDGDRLSLARVVQLRHTRNQRWIIWYAVLLVLLLFIFVPGLTRQSTLESWVWATGSVVVVQVLLWSRVLRNSRRLRNDHGGPR